jgi:uncharacterized repeat protein (TIGR01451 family)
MSKLARLGAACVLGLVMALAFILLSAANGVSAQSCQYQDNVSADSPLAYWRLGETSGLTASSIGLLGSAVDGTYQNGVTLGVSGLILGDSNSAAGLDGTDDYISIPGHALLNTGGPYSDKTIELWFQADTLIGRQVLYEQGGDMRGLNVYLDSGNLYLNAWNLLVDGPGSPWGPKFVSTAISTDTVYHVAMVYEGDSVSGGSITGYLNGISFGSVSGVGLLYGHADPVGIGRENSLSYYHDGPSGTADAYPFDGTIDEVALYDYALSPGRIRLHSNGCAIYQGLTKTASPTGSVSPSDRLTYTLAVTTSAPLSNLTISDTLPSGTSYVSGSGQLTAPVQKTRVTEYHIDSAQFTGISYTLTLSQNLVSNYFVVIQGSDGDGVWDSTTYLGPDKNYAALVADPFGTGDLGTSSGPSAITLKRGSASSGTDQG